MECCYCGKKIKEKDIFYLIEDNFYCTDCCKEETHTFYKVGADSNYDEDEVEEFLDMDEAITDNELKLERIKKTIKNFEKSNFQNKEYFIEEEKKCLQKVKNILTILKNEED